MPSRRPLRKSRFMPHTSERCSSARRWNGQFASAISLRAVDLGLVSVSRQHVDDCFAAIGASRERAGRRARLLADDAGRRCGRRCSGTRRSARRSSSLPRLRSRAGSRPGRNGARGPTPTPHPGSGDRAWTAGPRRDRYGRSCARTAPRGHPPRPACRDGTRRPSGERRVPRPLRRGWSNPDATRATG